MRTFRFLFCGGGLVAAMLCIATLGATPQKAHGLKWIILVCRAFEPEGQVSANGHLVKLHSTGDQRDYYYGERIDIAVEVYQPSTGAVGVGGTLAPIGSDLDPPESQRIIVRKLPGSPPFEPGPVIALAQAVRTYRGKVVGSWEWTSVVELKE
jgi:hypothetical protein